MRNIGNRGVATWNCNYCQEAYMFTNGKLMQWEEYANMVRQKVTK